ncbi:MAG TPA: efflux RND transporter periplasmic adaptor subunit, partial [Burkholderiaceae bacterium]|nr:efflux RND transporter periplasmic adaptor subunit [Burkholderiaceae bacterium]
TRRTLIMNVRTIALISCAGLLAVSASVGCTSRTAAAPAPPPTAEVGVVQVATQPVTMTAELPGRTVPVTVSEVRPRIRGIIQKRLFAEGQTVKAGQVLYEIDPALYQADYANAQATLARAEASRFSAKLLAERYAEVVKVEAVSKQESDNAQAAYRQADAEVAAARAALDTARITLDYTHITAPIAGVVSASVYTPGALVTTDQLNPLTTVRQLDPIYVDITQSSAQLLDLQRQLASGRLRRADGTIKVQLRLEDGTTYEHEGTLAFTDAAVDETTGMVHLRTVFPNPKRVLLPGKYVRAVLPLGVDEQALLVPQQALTHDARGNATVLLVNGDSKVEQRVVKAERTVRDQWLVTEGLAAGDRVVVEGVQKVQPGASVRVAEGAATVARVEAGGR